MAGFLLAAIPVLTLGLGGIETAYWSGLRQTLSLALMEAARAGATRQAQPQVIAQAFEYGLRMTYPDPQAAVRALRERRAHLGTPWRIHIVQPSPAAFLDHTDPDLQAPRAHPGQALIRNDYQESQQARRLAQGWPAGRGPRSDMNIHEANTLILDLWWPHRPLVPGVSALMHALAHLAGDPAQARLMAAGYLPFRRRVGVAMQSHPAAWPDLADGRVTHGTAPPPGWALSTAPKNSPPGWTDMGPLDIIPPSDPAAPPGTAPDTGAPDGRDPADFLDAPDDPDTSITEENGKTNVDTGPGTTACESAP